MTRDHRLPETKCPWWAAQPKNGHTTGQWRASRLRQHPLGAEAPPKGTVMPDALLKVSTFKAPPFAPRVWIEQHHLVLLFRDGQAIRVPLDDREAFFRYLQREESRHAINNPTEPWIERWSLAVQEKGAAVRHAAERRASRDALRASRAKGRAKRRPMSKVEADKLLGMLGL